MKLYSFSLRNAKEILRDPLTLFFGLGFPLVLLLLLSAIQANIPVSMFEIQHLTPGITVFGLSFMTLFSATVIAKDRGTSFLQRLYISPLKPVDFILGYTLPMLPIALTQALICYIAGVCLGLEITPNLLYAILGILPVAFPYISIGLLCGSVFTDKQVCGICGALLTNVSAWFSGIWFDLELVGGIFQKIANCLPFVHCVEMERALLNGSFSQALPHLWWILGYGVVLFTLAIFQFLHQMQER